MDPTHDALLRRAGELGLRRGSARDPAFRTSSVRRVRRGVFCIDPGRGPSFEESVVAALLALPPESVTCGHTAARLWRFEGVATDADIPLEFLVPAPRGNIALSGCVVRYETFTGVDLPDGIPATSRSRTLVDLIARANFADGMVLAECALRQDPSLAPDLRSELQLRVPPRGAAVVRQVLALADARSESVLESRARALWLSAGIPAPRQQAVIRDRTRFVARVDFLWDEARLVVEVDGMAKYAEAGALRDEKRRQNELIALGYRVLRFTWSDIVGRPDYVIAQVRASLIMWA